MTIGVNPPPAKPDTLRKRPSPLRFALPALLAVVALLAVFGAELAPQDPDAQNPALGAGPPGPGHPLGTDVLGRDVLSRLIVGTFPAVAGPVCVAIGVLVAGTLLGLLGGYHGGRIDAVIARGADILYSMPALLVAIVVIGTVGGGYLLTIGLLIVLTLPGTVRLIRSATLSQARLPYVDAARAMGVRPGWILGRHILPNIMPTVVATFLLEFTTALVSFSALSFLGLGVAPGAADWGTMLADGQELIFENPMMSLTPALLIVLTAVGATLVGDRLYDRATLATEAR
ncbi:ABC transporter permease [Rhizohabitans arisaemae]|uniref:ABC transporter permease n=1 Tax=Rhizohabitans arisaemae TaxID=2720610 RepID=UPI0024B15B1D|nr:ABC transporter permease [Rhizohabitans arisaemae]